MTPTDTPRRSSLARAWDLVWVRGLGRLLSLLLVAPIRVYQWTLSPLLAATCRYHPSCSRYAVGALQVHGPVKGLLLAGWRLVRCNPWTRGGLDPVPQRGRWRPDIHPDGRPRHADAVTGAPLVDSDVPDVGSAAASGAPHDDGAADAVPSHAVIGAEPGRSPAPQTHTGPVADGAAVTSAVLGTTSQGA